MAKRRGASTSTLSLSKDRGRSRSAARSGSFWSIFVGVVLVALAVRAAHIAFLYGSPPAVILLTNEARYDAWARSLLSGQAPSPPFDQPPLYPALLSVVYRLAGNQPIAMWWVQAVVDALQCGLLAWAGAGLFGIVAGGITGILAALYGPYVYHVAELVPATLGLAALVAAAISAMRGMLWSSIAAWAIAVALRPEFLLAALLVALFALWRKQRDLARFVALSAAGTLVVGSLVVSVLAGRPVPYSTGLGLNLWLGNNPAADGVSPIIPKRQEGFVQRVRFEADGDPLRADRAFLVAALRFWREFPAPALRLAWKKFRWTLINRELPNTRDVEWALSYSALFRYPARPLGFGILLVLAMAALPLLKSRVWNLWPFWAIAIATLLLCTTFFTNARFRLPLAPLLILLAGAGLARAVDWARSGCALSLSKLDAGVALACGALAAWLAFSNPYKVHQYRIAALVTNAGVAERLTGRFEKAEEKLREALALDHRDEIAWVHLVLAQEQRGHARGALRTLLDAGRIVPEGGDLDRAAEELFRRHNVPVNRWHTYRAIAEPAAQALYAREIEALWALAVPASSGSGTHPIDSGEAKP